VIRSSSTVRTSSGMRSAEVSIMSLTKVPELSIEQNPVGPATGAYDARRPVPIMKPSHRGFVLSVHLCTQQSNVSGYGEGPRNQGTRDDFAAKGGQWFRTASQQPVAAAERRRLCPAFSASR